MKIDKIINLLKNKKVVTGIITVVFVIGVISMFATQKKINQQNNVDNTASTTMETSNDNNVTDEEDSVAATEKSKDELDGFRIGNSDAEKISDMDADRIISQVRLYTLKNDWESAYDTIKEIINTYNFDTEKGVKLQKIYYDASIVNSLKNVTSDKHDSMFNNFRDEEDLLITILQLPEEERRKLILSVDSLSPIFTGDINITSCEDYTGDYFKQVITQHPEIQSIKKIDFSVEGYNLVAYVGRYDTNNLKLLTINGVEGEETPFKTVADWQKLDDWINGNLEKRKTVKDGEVYNENSPSQGVSTVWGKNAENTNKNVTLEKNENIKDTTEDKNLEKAN